MIVGCMRKGKKPNHFIKTLSMMSKYYGVDLLYINPENVNHEKNKVKGKILLNNNWIDIETDIPKFIDVKSTLYNNKDYKKILEELKSKATLSVDKRLPIPKDKLYDFFENEDELSKYLIPFKLIDRIDDVFDFIDIYNKVVIKPVKSNGGRNVLSLEKKEEKILVGLNKSYKVLSRKDFERYYIQLFDGKSVIVQKYIESVDDEGNPIDCRIHVEKDINGEWKNVANFIRIGVGQKIVSNISQGGGVIEAKKYLKIKYKDNWKEIYKEIRMIAKKLPRKIESILGKEYMTLGFDVGLTNYEGIYLFEINDNPMVDPIISKVALSRAGYYKFMLDELNQNPYVKI